MRRKTSSVLNRDHTLIRSLVRQRRTRHQITDRINPRRTGPHRAINLNQATLIQPDPGRLKSETIDIRATPGGDHDIVSLTGLPAIAEPNGVLAADHIRDQHARVHIDALLLETTLGKLRNIRILSRQHPVQRLKQLHAHTKPRIRRGDLTPRRTRTDHRQRPRQLTQRPRLLSPDHTPTKLDPRNRTPHRPSRQHNKPRLKNPVTHRHPAITHKRG